MSQAPPPPPKNDSEQSPHASRVVLFAWVAALIMALAAGGAAIWQVSEKFYTPGHTAQEYWDSISRGSGSEALGFFESEGLETGGEDNVDSVLLDGSPLEASSTAIEDPRFGEDPEGGGDAVMQFAVEGENYETRLPMESHESTLAVFKNWELTSGAMSQLQIDVPGAAAGGIAQIDVNGEPVNLVDDTATLRSYVPAVVEIAVDSEWLVGTARYVVVQEAGAQGEAEAHQITLDLKASEAAEEVLHEEVEEYLASCADQQVLMPAGCPMGINTPNQVVTESITWQMPEPEDLSLGFDEDGWETSETEMEATINFDSRHFHDGESLQESHDVGFDLDVEVGASGEELIVSVTGAEPPEL